MMCNRSFKSNQRTILLLLPLIIWFSAGAAFAQGTAFTFQGKLGDSGTPVNNALDMQFKLFDGADPNNSSQIGTTITLNNPLVQVTNGVFTVQLDFGAASLPGADRFLEVGIRLSNTDPYTLLSPRTKITSSPYAIRSLNATGADGLSSACVGCIQSSQINSVDANKLTGTIPSGTISVSSIPSGSGNYIQNSTSQQAASSFNISGNGIVGGSLGIGTAAPSSILHVVGTQGADACPICFGDGGGAPSVLQVVGGRGGNANGRSRGGAGANVLIKGGDGGSGGLLGDAGNGGNIMLQPGGPGANNAGSAGTAGSIILNGPVTVPSTNLVGIGTAAPSAVLHVTSSPGADCANALCQGGTPPEVLQVIGGKGGNATFAFAHAGNGAGVFIKGGDGGDAPAFPGNGGDVTIRSGAAGGQAQFAGRPGLITLDGPVRIPNGAVGIGTPQPEQTLHVNGQAILSTGATGGFKFRDRASTSAADDWTWYSNGNVARFNRAGVGDLISVTTDGFVGIGTPAPNSRLNVVGNFTVSAGLTTIGLLGAAGNLNLCLNNSGQISTCSSSIRYKQNINSFNGGLSLVNRLRPVSFNWKADNKADMGLVAEEVAKISPLLVTHNDKGEVEGVKYDRVSVVLINAIKEQQSQIAVQQKMIEQQQKEINALKRRFPARSTHWRRPVPGSRQ